MSKKGENLATLEDIQGITQKQEQILQSYRKEFEEFSIDRRFKNDFYFKQLTELYNLIYAIVCQSEYIRGFIKLKDNLDLKFDDVPFIEISDTERVQEKFDFKKGEAPRFSKNIEYLETELSMFNKKLLCDYIISHGQFASQKLLRLAVSYRFAYNWYSGNPEIRKNIPDDDIVNYGTSQYDIQRKIADEEEVRLIKEIVRCIVKEYNLLRKELNMSYEEEELKTGMLTDETGDGSLFDNYAEVSKKQKCNKHLPFNDRDKSSRHFCR